MTLVVRDLSKSFVTRRSMFGRPLKTLVAVDRVSFDVQPGETVALVGESGSGKSTTARLVLRLIEADAGQVSFEGTDIRALGARELRRFRRRMQIIFQDPIGSFDARLTIGTSITEPLEVHEDMRPSERLRIAGELLERVGLSPRDLRKYPRELSGGQLQRASIARALTLKPSLLICDESVSALDVSIRAQVLNLLTELQNDLGVSYLFITHDLSVVRAFAHRVNVMSKGRIVEAGSIDAIFLAPREAYTKQLISAGPKLVARPRVDAPGAS